jgi:2-polyprenyl-3-methyl-5-hydroxy-6-metoxy-1,4-benzoquinol methylase
MSKAYGLDLICQDIDNVSFVSNTFDVVIMRMVLEHVFHLTKPLRR